MAKSARQPHVGATNAPSAAPSPVPIGIAAVTMPPIIPRLAAGMNSCTSGRSTQYRPPTPKPTKKRNTVRKTQPFSGVSARIPVATEKLITVAMKTLRRPIRSASQPQNQAPAIAPMPEESRMIADSP